MPASPANPWASHWGYSCTDSPKGDFGFFDKAENEDDLGGIGENGEHCAGRVRYVDLVNGNELERLTPFHLHVQICRCPQTQT